MIYVNKMENKIFKKEQNINRENLLFSAMYREIYFYKQKNVFKNYILAPDKKLIH
jgi:hypothetical protein